MAKAGIDKKYPIVIFDGDKGGVGKSAACGAFADFCIARNIPIAIVDGDARNPDVGRIFNDLVPVGHANLRLHDGWMDLMDFVHANMDRIIVISMPAGIGSELTREAHKFMRMAKDLERAVGLVWVINRTIDSVNLLNSALESLGGGLHAKFVLKNLFFGEAGKFRRWDDSNTKKKFESAGGVTLELAELHERVMDKLFADVNNIMPYTAAAVPMKDIQNTPSPHKLSPSENVELHTWLQENENTFRTMAAGLGIAVE
jgi:hypothetical protein